MKRYIKVFGLLAMQAAVFGLLTGCALESGQRGQAPEAKQGAVAIEGQEKGRGYFLRECGACHRHFWPGERTVGEWQGILPRKKNKVSLTADQFRQLSDYVIQASRGASGQP